MRQGVSEGPGSELWLHEDEIEKTDVSEEALPRSEKQELLSPPTLGQCRRRVNGTPWKQSLATGSSR